MVVQAVRLSLPPTIWWAPRQANLSIPLETARMSDSHLSEPETTRSLVTLFHPPRVVELQASGLVRGSVNKNSSSSITKTQVLINTMFQAYSNQITQPLPLQCTLKEIQPSASVQGEMLFQNKFLMAIWDQMMLPQALALTIHWPLLVRMLRHLHSREDSNTVIRLWWTSREMFLLQDFMETNFAQIDSEFTIKIQNGVILKLLDGVHLMIDSKS